MGHVDSVRVELVELRKAGSRSASTRFHQRRSVEEVEDFRAELACRSFKRVDEVRDAILALVDLLGEPCEEGVEFLRLRSLASDLVDRVNDGRVVLATELLSDVRERRLRHLLAQPTRCFFVCDRRSSTCQWRSLRKCLTNFGICLPLMSTRCKPVLCFREIPLPFKVLLSLYQGQWPQQSV